MNKYESFMQYYFEFRGIQRYVHVNLNIILIHYQYEMLYIAFIGQCDYFVIVP